jgi:hypothetical protein
MLLIVLTISMIWIMIFLPLLRELDSEYRSNLIIRIRIYGLQIF